MSDRCLCLLLLLAGVTMGAISGCDWSPMRQTDRESYTDVLHLDYNGHMYLRFQERYAATTANGYVHDPDCTNPSHKAGQ